ncbi:MAG: ribose 5-phosphate isomerase A [archaeon]|nr:ribose 5-phosphate isomerase A [archaeon]
MATTELGLIESAKRAAAHLAVDRFVASDMVVGIGSGSTVVYAVERLIELARSGQLSGVRCVPTSFQAVQLVQAGAGHLTLTDLNAHPSVDVTIDGADEVDEALNLIKGGGACMFQEKLVAYNSATLVIVADYRKRARSLGTAWKKGVPVEVSPLAHASVSRHIASLTGGQPKLRMATEKCGPVVTDNGNFVLDVVYPEASLVATALPSLNAQLLGIPGVIETGLFINLAAHVIYGEADGCVELINRSPTTS